MEKKPQDPQEGDYDRRSSGVNFNPAVLVGGSGFAKPSTCARRRSETEKPSLS